MSASSSVCYKNLANLIIKRATGWQYVVFRNWVPEEM